jgi:hypothetical protein
MVTKVAISFLEMDISDEGLWRRQNRTIHYETPVDLFLLENDVKNYRDTVKKMVAAWK